jgi:hypothetical protein
MLFSPLIKPDDIRHIDHKLLHSRLQVVDARLKTLLYHEFMMEQRFSLAFIAASEPCATHFLYTKSAYLGIWIAS